MKLRSLWRYKILIGLCCLGCAMYLMPTSALSVSADNVSDQGQQRSRHPLHLVQQRECSRRAGPYVTQSTALQRRRQAQSQGYGVSGVFPCYDGGTRGYCFNVFFPC